MRIIQKLADNRNMSGITIAFLGDSVTQGCFELYRDKENTIVPVFDQNSTYHEYLRRILSMLYPAVPVTMINAGISGDCAPCGYERLERDVLQYRPDLVVVCYGLNDVTKGAEGLEIYCRALTNIFKRLKEAGIEIVFMTPNMMNTYVNAHDMDDEMKSLADLSARLQTEGSMDTYVAAAREVCRQQGVTVCDCYAKWKRLHEVGVNVTELLSNKMNHPTREMNWLFAVSLLQTIIEKDR